VLSADAQLDVGAGLAAAGNSQPDELAHTDCVDGLEGVEGQQAVLGVELQELRLWGGGQDKRRQAGRGSAHVFK
jgi:hypothetical protein